MSELNICGSTNITAFQAIALIDCNITGQGKLIYLLYESYIMSHFPSFKSNFDDEEKAAEEIYT